MGLTGLEIFKQLPKKNCGECGPPTCLAFAMALANGKATLDTCPYVSDEAKENLDSASAPPIKLIKIGTGDKTVQIGEETEIFRHDKRFFNPTAVVVKVDDTDDVAAKVENFDSLEFERVGLTYVVDMVAINNASGDAAKFKEAVETAASKTEKPLVLMSEDTAAMEAALGAVAERKPLICAATSDNFEKMTELAKSNSCPLVVKGNGLEDTAALIDKVVALGYKELVIDTGERETSKVLADLTQMRRLAIKKRFRTFGYPNITFTSKEDAMEEIAQATVYLSKYASSIVLNTDNKAHLLPLLSWRQNLYTDPQKPIQVEPKLYEVGKVDENSPVYVTTNFSLTYYIVEGEVETSKIPSYIIAVDTDGISVLTAWAAGKLTAESINAAMKKHGVADKVNHKKLIIPGHVAVLSGSIEEETGWEIVVGPREASGIPKFAKANL